MPLHFLFRIPPTYFGVLSNFLARFFFFPLALRFLLLAFFGCPVSFFPAYFHPKPSLVEHEL